MSNGTVRTTDICLEDTTVGCPGPDKTCPWLFSDSELGSYCRLLNTTFSDKQRDANALEYCTQHPNHELCKCINRGRDENYRRLKQQNPYNDACWWIPCTNRFKWFVQSQFEQTPECPENLCQVIYNIAQTHDVKIKDVENVVNCDFSHGGVIPHASGVPNLIYVGMLLLLLSYIIIYSIR